jgi:hypothetical protein
VSKEEAWKQVAALTIGRFEKVDILFFNAGIYLYHQAFGRDHAGRLESPDVDQCDWRRIRDRRRRHCLKSGEGKAYEPRT